MERGSRPRRGKLVKVKDKGLVFLGLSDKWDLFSLW